MKCPNCNNKMSDILHFEKGKNFAYHKCKCCNTKTHQKRIHFEELNEKHMLNKKI